MKPGYSVTTGVSIIAGKPVRFDASDATGATIMLAAGGCVVGLALDNNVSALCNNLTNFEYDSVRGNLISYVCGAGNEVEVGNDGRGDVFVTGDTFTVGTLVYSTAAGLISTTVLGNAIGRVTKTPASATDTLRIQLAI